MKNVPPEWINLSKSLHQIATIKQSRVSPTKLFKAHQNKATFEKRDSDGEIYAFGVLWPTRSKQWLEIGTIWVHPDHEGKGLSNEIITTLNKKARGRRKSSFLCCSNQNKHIQGIVKGMDYMSCSDPLNSPISKAWGSKRTSKNRAVFYFEHTS